MKIQQAIIEETTTVINEDATKHHDGTPRNLDPDGINWIQDLFTCGAGNDCKCKGKKALDMISRCAVCGWCCHHECGVALAKNI